MRCCWRRGEFLSLNFPLLAETEKKRKHKARIRALHSATRYARPLCILRRESIKKYTKLNTLRLPPERSHVSLGALSAWSMTQHSHHSHTHSHTHTHSNTFSCWNDLLTVEWLSSSLISTFWTQSKEAFFPSACLFRRTEPQCITCDGDVLWSSRYYYDNCSHFGAHIAPQSSISSDAGVDYYILECRGPGLPLAGEFFFSSSQFFFCAKKKENLSRAGKLCTGKRIFLGAPVAVFVRAHDKNQLQSSTSLLPPLIAVLFFF